MPPPARHHGAPAQGESEHAGLPAACARQPRPAAAPIQPSPPSTQLLNPTLSAYRDRRFDGDQAAFDACLAASATLYVGNLSFYTTEEQLHDAFSRAGDVLRIIMGLDKHRKTPCGFAFVVFYARSDAEDAVKYVNGTMLDDRPIRVDHDWGFQEGRQFGRGRSGGQVRDEYRDDYDAGRGGFGALKRTHEGGGE